MKPIAPMLAVPMSKADITDWSLYVAEEKFDGWRFVVTIPAFGDFVAHTRERKHAGGGPKDQNDASDLLTPDVKRDLERLRPRTGWLVLDGEYLAIHPDGRVGTSTDVPRKELAKRFVAFDVLHTAQGSCMMLAYGERRRILQALFATDDHDMKHAMLSEVRPCVDTESVSAFTHEVWNRGGEGLILKLKSARYEAGKRRAAFVKVKKLLTAVLTITGFEATRGTVMNRGSFASVLLRDDAGKETSVKTRDDVELERFRQQWEKRCETLAIGDPARIDGFHLHPAIGRKLRIEYQDIAADGGYRHPRWDRWEEE